jgi:hypothetical protein
MTHGRWLGVALLVVGAAACNQGGGSTESAQSLGEKCATSSDCKSGEACIANVCAPAIVADLGVPLCKVTSDCQSGDICAHGVCLPQQLGGVTLCDKDADCASGDQCLAQVCVPQLPTGGNLPPFDLGAITGGVGVQCMQNSDCTNGLDCAFGFCLPVQTCMTDADCSGGKHCATQAGICF